VPSNLEIESALDHRRLYDYRFAGIDQGARQRVWDVIGPWIHERMGSPRRVLDPAAGRFEFMKSIVADERVAVDAVDSGYARTSGIKLTVGDALDVDLPSGRFDGVFVSHFLEHLSSPSHVALLLRRLNRSMAPGGRIAVLGPNFRYCAPEYFDCADHILALSHVSVAEHLHAAGFEVTTIIPRFLPFSFRGVLPPSPTLTSAYLRMPVAWRLLGKQLLVIARAG
jgi:SAM-dependent methyltransferase